ncbi:MAG: hypothetical protein LIQ31_05510 [Planctomycetes bacterium]|nr:hypothetical protein [Planctomycetota bacterium]
MEPKAYLEITLSIPEAKRGAAAKVYSDFRQPFLDTIKGAVSKNLLVRDEDVQVLHGFQSADVAAAYLKTNMFNDDVVQGLQPLWDKAPDVRIYTIA